MTAKPPRVPSRLSREVLVVVALTVAGAVFRIWSPGRLGLIHFDEGIYALAGLWSLSPRGLAGIDPTLIAFAPPGFPVLVGLSYLVFGVSDLAAIVVSVGSGTLTIPVAAWLAWRTFGPGAGGAAAAFAAFSGPHLAFSRMALTDVSFLLFWLIAVGLGQRFLERPGSARAILLGCAVGLAQLFKYNGWILGAIVAVGAVGWPVTRREGWRTRSMAATWGYGLLAAVTAAVVYWPWFAFVTSHGGYAALLAHQRSYASGVRSWPGQLSQQLDQSDFLAGGPLWLAYEGAIAALAMSVSVGQLPLRIRLLARTLMTILGLVALCSIPGLSWWLGLCWIFMAVIWKGAWATKSAALLGAGWLILSVLTPFYHPYARLWLPIEALGWVFLAGAFVGIRSSVEVAGRGRRWSLKRDSDPLPWFVFTCVFFAVTSRDLQPETRAPSSPAPSDSLRQACQSIKTTVPNDVRDLRVYARPPVLFYLAFIGGVNVQRQPDVAHLLEPANPSSWALLDMALIRQDNVPESELGRLLAGWVVVCDLPTVLNLPTLLDIEPAVARGGVIDASAPLRLLRPRRTEDVR